MINVCLQQTSVIEDPCNLISRNINYELAATPPCFEGNGMMGFQNLISCAKSIDCTDLISGIPIQTNKLPEPHILITSIVHPYRTSIRCIRIPNKVGMRPLNGQVVNGGRLVDDIVGGDLPVVIEAAHDVSSYYETTGGRSERLRLSAVSV